MENDEPGRLDIRILYTFLRALGPGRPRATMFVPVSPHVSHFFVAKRRRVLSGLDESVKRR